MLYRKAPPTPPRLLLRIVATAGAGALLGFTGCSSSSTVNGVVVSPEAGYVPSDASDDASPPCGVVFCDIVSNPSDAEAEFDVTSHPTGVVPYNPDAAGSVGPSRSRPTRGTRAMRATRAITTPRRPTTRPSVRAIRAAS